MSCITKGNKRCTKCCEAIHIPKSSWKNSLSGKFNWVDYDTIKKYWIPISKRRAKKINPWIFNQRSMDSKEYDLQRKRWLTSAQFFTCKALDKEKGCTIRDEDFHPNICKSYKGGYDYSYTCNEDINIIARSG